MGPSTPVGSRPSHRCEGADPPPGRLGAVEPFPGSPWRWNSAEQPNRSTSSRLSAAGFAALSGTPRTPPARFRGCRSSPVASSARVRRLSPRAAVAHHVSRRLRVHPPAAVEEVDDGHGSVTEDRHDGHRFFAAQEATAVLGIGMRTVAAPYGRPRRGCGTLRTDLSAVCGLLPPPFLSNSTDEAIRLDGLGVVRLPGQAIQQVAAG